MELHETVGANVEAVLAVGHAEREAPAFPEAAALELPTRVAPAQIEALDAVALGIDNLGVQLAHARLVEHEANRLAARPHVADARDSARSVARPLSDEVVAPRLREEGELALLDRQSRLRPFPGRLQRERALDEPTPVGPLDRALEELAAHDAQLEAAHVAAAAGERLL